MAIRPQYSREVIGLSTGQMSLPYLALYEYTP
jgi:hypothetical protein